MKLNYKRTILIGLAFLSITAFWQFYDDEIPKILKYNFNLGETLTGAVMALDNVLALFLLPLFGTLSDKTHTRIGKRMPFILTGTAIASVGLFVLISFARPSGSLLFFIIVLFVILIAMGIYRSPAVSLMPDLTPAPLRSQGNAVINLMGALGGVYILVMTFFLIKSVDDPAQTNYTPLMISVVLIMIVPIIILFFTIKENRISKEIEEQGGLGSFGENLTNDAAAAKSKENTKLPKDVYKSLIFLLLSVAFWYMAYNAVTTAYTRFVEEVWDIHNGSYAITLLVATATAVISYIPIGALSSRFGRKKTIISGVILMSVCYLAACFFPQYNSFVNILFGLVGIGWAAINVNSYPMVVEMSRSGDIGKYTGTYYTFSMAAQVLTPILSGFLIEHISYRVLFPYAFVFSTLALFTMLMVRHGDSKPTGEQIKEDIFNQDL